MFKKSLDLQKFGFGLMNQFCGCREKKSFCSKNNVKYAVFFQNFEPSKGKILKSSKQVNSSTRKSKIAGNRLRTPKKLVKTFW